KCTCHRAQITAQDKKGSRMKITASPKDALPGLRAAANPIGGMSTNLQVIDFVLSCRSPGVVVGVVRIPVAGSELAECTRVRIALTIVYSTVCTLGVLGNLLVFFLLGSRHHRRKSSVTFFMLNLAVTNFQFVLTFWPLGKLMCKLISSVSAMNMYASVFFLTAMSVTHYCSVVSSLKANRGSSSRRLAKVASAIIWLFAALATLPHAIFSTTHRVSGDELCLVKFPELKDLDPQFLLGLYQTQKVLLGFVIPLAIISACYILLLRFLSRMRMSSSNPKARSRVTKLVTIVVLSFFLCWLPNQALTAWGIFIKFNLVPFTEAFYNTQAYIFPITVCLAHTNSCLNPILYCLVRREFREALKGLLLKVTPSFGKRASKAHPRQAQPC
uniref:G-protein coupled receptors family 1 profile domain-containing protein n=1 Tax=Chelonoidis abingdonii TaxID=106734 RepID=A0A8C0G172_CHEAB